MQASSSIDYKTLYEKKSEAYDALQITVTSLQQQLLQLQKMIFGSKQERFVPADNNTSQLSLDIQAEVAGSCSVVEAKKISYTRTTTSTEQKPLTHPGRMKLPEHLRREEIIIGPKEDTTGLKKIGEEITEVLDYSPGELFVKKYVRSKYAKGNSEGVLIGELPSRPLEKAMAGEGLLAQIVIDKYVDHLPLYRQMKRFERSGVKLSYSTLTDWVSSTCKLIEPLFEALKKQVIASNYLHADETHVVGSLLET